MLKSMIPKIRGVGEGYPRSPESQSPREAMGPYERCRGKNIFSLSPQKTGSSAGSEPGEEWQELGRLRR